MANSMAKAAKVKGSRLRQDLIRAMDQASEAKAKLKDIFDQLRTKRMLVIKKDKEIQLVKQKVSNECENIVADFQAFDAFLTVTLDEFFKGFELLWRWMMKHHSEANDYSDLDFEAIHKEMMADEDLEEGLEDPKLLLRMNSLLTLVLIKLLTLMLLTLLFEFNFCIIFGSRLSFDGFCLCFDEFSLKQFLLFLFL